MIKSHIDNFLKIAKIPESLNSIGIDKKDLKGFYNFAKQAKVAFSFNPIKIQKKDLIDLIY